MYLFYNSYDCSIAQVEEYPFYPLYCNESVLLIPEGGPPLNIFSEMYDTDLDACILL
jgi:hypothetical protein